MSSEVSSLALLLLVLGLGAWGLVRSDALDPFTRRAVCATVLAANGVYLAWRLQHTLPASVEPGTLVAWVYLGIEMLALAESCLLWLCLSRTTERPGQALPAWPPAGEVPAVEIWIPTYQEPLEVLEKSILAALAVDYERLKVRVLDDGNRDWLREQCAAWGADYVTREEHRHAKAGNLNNALASSQADFVVIMDADFAAYRHFVRRTLPHFADERLAVLQTPQTFYNPDLAQQNLALGGRIADEQALFFREIQPARDAWDAAFFCGSCAMLRVAALREAGGFPTDSITEDLLTSLKLLGRGWKTRFLNERLSMGLAAESIEAFFVQRDRWCRGAIEVLFLPDGPLRNPRLTLMQRLLYLPLYWLVSPFFHLALMVLPVVSLLTGLEVMYIEDPADVYLLALPVLLVNLMALTWISRGRYSPLISTALSMLMAVRLSWSAIRGLLRPGSTGFAVTPKGSQVAAATDRLLFKLMMGLTLATLAAMVYAGWVSHTPQHPTHATPWLIALGVFNLLHFLVALVIVEDKPRLRSEERFRIAQAMRLRASSGREHEVQVEDMSASGLRLHWPHPEATPERAELGLADQWLPLALIQQRGAASGAGTDLVFRFEGLAPVQRSALIQHLFSGRFAPVVQRPPGLAGALRQTVRSVLQTSP